MPAPDESLPFARTILQALATDPDRVVLRYQSASLGNRPLAAGVQRLMGALQARGISKGCVVGVCFERSPDLLAVLLALWNCGAVYLPLDPRWPLQRLRGCLDVANVALVLYQQACGELAGQLPVPVLRIERIRFEADTPTEGEPTLPPLFDDDPAYILFTSGSSGLPKGVQITHGNLDNLLRGSLPLLELKSGWRYLASTSLYFDLVFFELLAPLLCRGTLVLADEAVCRDPARLVALVRNEQVDVVQATPSMWQLLLLEGLGGIRTLPLALSCGEALSAHTARKLLACSSALWNLYGPTECTLWASGIRLSPTDLSDDGRAAPIGFPLPGYGFELLQAPDAECSELRISGKSVGSYLGNDAANALRFGSSAEGTRWFLSGDCCTRDTDQCYHFHHRRDTQLKVNGYRMEAGEIEHFLTLVPGIAQACCLAKSGAQGESRLLAFVVCQQGMPNKDRAAWNSHLAAFLPEWMLPQQYFVLDSLPLTPNGKIDRRALLALTEIKPAATQSCTADLQYKVGRIFCEILECEAIGPYDSFFDAGGNSMLSATLVMALNQHFGSKLRLGEVLASPPTVSSVSKLLQADQQA